MACGEENRADICITDFVAVGLSTKVAGNGAVDDAVLRLSAMVTKVAAVECWGEFDTLLVMVGSGLRIEALATVINLEG